MWSRACDSRAWFDALCGLTSRTNIYATHRDRPGSPGAGASLRHKLRGTGPTRPPRRDPLSRRSASGSSPGSSLHRGLLSGLPRAGTPRGAERERPTHSRTQACSRYGPFRSGGLVAAAPRHGTRTVIHESHRAPPLTRRRDATHRVPTSARTGCSRARQAPPRIARAFSGRSRRRRRRACR